jgi:hypothetical protein
VFAIANCPSLAQEGFPGAAAIAIAPAMGFMFMSCKAGVGGDGRQGVGSRVPLADAGLQAAMVFTVR